MFVHVDDSRIISVFENCFIDGEVRNMSGLSGYINSEDPSRIKELIKGGQAHVSRKFMKESRVVTRCQVTIEIFEQYGKRNMVKTQRLIFEI